MGSASVLASMRWLLYGAQKRDVTSATGPRNDICNRPYITPQKSSLHHGLTDHFGRKDRKIITDFINSKNRKNAPRHICNHFLRRWYSRWLNNSTASVSRVKGSSWLVQVGCCGSLGFFLPQTTTTAFLLSAVLHHRSGANNAAQRSGVLKSKYTHATHSPQGQT